MKWWPRWCPIKFYIAAGHVSERPLLTLAKVDSAGRVTILPGIGFRIVYLDHCHFPLSFSINGNQKLVGG